MAVDEQTVRKIARLARIKLADEDIAPLTKDLSAILTFVEQLSEVDTEGVEAQESGHALSLFQRVDDVTDGGYADRVTQNAPKEIHNFYAVPKVVE